MKYREVVHRYKNNPIITIENIPGAIAVYNASATIFEEKILLLLTVRTYGSSPVFLKAISEDGINFEIYQEPLIQPEPYENWICDPRITRIGDIYYIVYWSGDKYGCRSVLCQTTDFERIERLGYICEPDNRNIVLFPEKINGYYARLDRPMGVINNGDIWISYSPDLIHWGNSKPIIEKGPIFSWDGEKIGPGAPPFKTEEGWIEIFHAVQQGFFQYYLGCALLDTEDPSKVIGRSPEAILMPREDYERIGSVPNVVFTCGVVPNMETGKVNLYYAGADQCICLALTTIDELLSACKR